MASQPKAASNQPLLICYDGSEDAKHAIEEAGQLFGGRRALVLTVWQITASLGSFSWAGMIAPMIDLSTLDKQAAENAERIADEGVLAARNAGIEAEPITVRTSEPVWQTIVTVADGHDVAAIVIGSRGLTATRSILQGSVSTAVMHHTTKPTLIISHL